MTMVTNDLQVLGWSSKYTPPKTNGWKLKIMVSNNRNLIFQGSKFQVPSPFVFAGDNPLGFPQFPQATKKQRDVGRSSARDAKQEAAVPAWGTLRMCVGWLLKEIYPGSQRLLIKHIIVRSLFWMIDILKNVVFGEKTTKKI